ncbi:type I DNA topoisomerase [Buchnera aphidicola (Aphis helianthi)]|uniref:DNA topoisomerase 1 n=1 Tax=Buchnera aphidicola (Aphis helianthi) TaxID=2315802 RepID=A0A4D6XKR5_9GAMM|nr:type I DNA topoisomerase [Buchnera aphidicola]QCI17103.1 type I DNA topoisomerase [Buchnera aphidicola (Aphis helianthi)]
MYKSLVIVESPVKAKTINQYLGDKYIVKSSVGHVRDLLSNQSKKRKKKKNSFSEYYQKQFIVQKMGINPYKNWNVEYHILPGKEKIVNELKNIAKNVDRIYLATDLDREGEAIAWHLKEVIGGDSSKFIRVVFNEITQHSIEKAFKNVGQINMNRVYAQQARRFMDRIVGYMISPLLWEKICRGLSAGRVQSVAVRIVVEREEEIKNFIAKEHWKINISFLTSEKKNIVLELTHYKNKKITLNNEKKVNLIIEKIKHQSFYVTDRKDKILYQKPPAPFITSTLQQSSSLHLGFSVKKTMFLAQKLYEEGYITYMRTDSFFLSNHAIKKARNYIKNYYGNNFLPIKPNIYLNKKYSQEAHEAIRPTDVEVTTINQNRMSSDAIKLYKLIWNRFIACQMKSKKYKSIIIKVITDKFKLKTSVNIILFKGWTKIIQKSNIITCNFSEINVGDILFIEKILPTKIFTKPSPRFNEASLVRELEKKGIGRPSTYASIITKIKDKGYLKIENNKFYATKIGAILINQLKKCFTDLVDYDFTARMEKKLDQISDNKISWKNVLNIFFENFSKQFEQAKKPPEEGGMANNITILTNINCSICNKKMGIKTAITGVFLSCSGYNLKPKERCKNTINLISLNDANLINKDNMTIKKLKRKCEKCHIIMDEYLINDKLKIYICTNSPICTIFYIKKGKFESPIYLSKTLYCEKCKNNMLLKIGKFGKFFMCVNKMCKNTRKILSNGEIAQPKLEPIPFPDISCIKSDAWFVLREGISGIFFAAHTFPKSRETRSPLVEELAQFKHLLPKKLHYLADAPKTDKEGNKTIVCFDKLNKKQYIASKKEGKFTGWSAFFVKNKWLISNKS